MEAFLTFSGHYCSCLVGLDTFSVKTSLTDILRSIRIYKDLASVGKVLRLRNALSISLYPFTSRFRVSNQEDSGLDLRRPSMAYLYRYTIIKMSN
jgi:hypothetical protein